MSVRSTGAGEGAGGGAAAGAGGAGTELLLRILRAELLRRLPDAVIVEADAAVGGLDALVEVDAEVDAVGAFGDAEPEGAEPLRLAVGGEIAMLAPRVFDAALLERRRAIAARLGWIDDRIPGATTEVGQLPIEDALAIATAPGAAPVSDPAVAMAVTSLRGPRAPAAEAAIDARLDEITDRVSARADAGWREVSEAGAPPRGWVVVRDLHRLLHELGAAYDARGERLMTERVAMADEVARLLVAVEELRSGQAVGRLEAELVASRALVERYERERATLQAELARARAGTSDPVPAPGR